MIVETFPVGMLGCNCSVVGDEASRSAIVIDPGDEIDLIQEAVQRHGLTVKLIVITHAHIDHIGGAHKLRLLTGAPVFMHPADKMLSDHMAEQAAWLGVETPEVPGIDKEAHDGDVFRTENLDVHVLHTPGHTEGSISLYVPAESLLFAGDTLFHGSIGRTDLPGGDMAKIKRSIQGQLYTLPDETVVVPGHGERTTIGREKRLNPFVRG